MRHAWMDQGGTFTDVVTVDEDGHWRVRKVLSDRADLVALARGAHDVRRGTTVATNALLERALAPVILVTTTGFEDALEFGDQVRPELFARTVRRGAPLGVPTVAAPGRLGPDGRVEVPFDLDVLEHALPTGLSWSGASVAVCLVHGVRAPHMVERVAARCRALGAVRVSVGPEVAPMASFLDRLRTTVLDAALSPLLPRIPGQWMCSDGGLAGHDSPQWRGARAVLSGPAGGAVSTAAHAVRSGRACGFIGLDMGGTSTDICRVTPQGRVGTVDRVVVDGLGVATPAVRVDTIAAGGGSVLGVRGGVFTVGPGSAGADPGPTCYGRGGPLALTDAEAILGRLPGFPHVAGPSRTAPLDVEEARRAMQRTGPHAEVEVLAEGYRRVAHSRMAGAVRRIAAEDGADPADHILVAFGGAGPAHACGVARELGIVEVHVPVLAGVWSAVGIGQARPRLERRAPVTDSLEAALDATRLEDGPERSERLTVLLQHVGTTGVLELELDPDEPSGWALDARRVRREGEPARVMAQGALRERFDAEHKRLHGFCRPGLPVEVVAVRRVREGAVQASGPVRLAQGGPGETHTRAWFAGRWREVPLVTVGSEPVAGFSGPALVKLPGATLVVEPGWSVRHAGDHLILIDGQPAGARLGRERHSVHTAVFGARLAGIAEAMGESLARLARSVSIRERRDFSCAIFDAAGRLAVNAPHVPVHLGAMGETVRALVAARAHELAPGQAWVTNDPYAGGSHLPDITVIRPVFCGEGHRIAFVACRGHHVDVGGVQPGSMPPHATTLDEEGAVVPMSLLVDASGCVHLPPLPGCRQLAEVHADLLAQVAACASGAEAVASLAEAVGAEVVCAQLGHLQAVAADAVAEALAGFSGRHKGSTSFDDGTPLAVTIDFPPGGGVVSVHIDAPAHPGNLNAPGAVARAAVLYVLRCMVGAPIPLNEGVLDLVQVTVSPGGLFDPSPPRAVAGGNVETSQVLVDTLMVALGLAAASQGTMNNLTVGTEAGAFYETIGGGAGATAEGAGASAIQVHMTNTRSTDVEVLERRFPVRLELLARRWGSGGQGIHCGGDGVTKVWRFLGPAQVAILAGRRTAGAPGLDGGESGAPGADTRDIGAGWEPCPAVWTAQEGHRLRIDTPGGGGWGFRD